MPVTSDMALGSQGGAARAPVLDRAAKARFAAALTAAAKGSPREGRGEAVSPQQTPALDPPEIDSEPVDTVPSLDDSPEPLNLNISFFQLPSYWSHHKNAALYGRIAGSEAPWRKVVDVKKENQVTGISGPVTVDNLFVRDDQKLEFKLDIDDLEKPDTLEADHLFGHPLKEEATNEDSYLLTHPARINDDGSLSEERIAVIRAEVDEPEPVPGPRPDPADAIRMPVDAVPGGLKDGIDQAFENKGWLSEVWTRLVDLVNNLPSNGRQWLEGQMDAVSKLGPDHEFWKQLSGGKTLRELAGQPAPDLTPGPEPSPDDSGETPGGVVWKGNHEVKVQFIGEFDVKKIPAWAPIQDLIVKNLFGGPAPALRVSVRAFMPLFKDGKWVAGDENYDYLLQFRVGAQQGGDIGIGSGFLYEGIDFNIAMKKGKPVQSISVIPAVEGGLLPQLIPDVLGNLGVGDNVKKWINFAFGQGEGVMKGEMPLTWLAPPEGFKGDRRSWTPDAFGLQGLQINNFNALNVDIPGAPSEGAIDNPWVQMTGIVNLNQAFIGSAGVGFTEDGRRKLRDFPLLPE